MEELKFVQRDKDGFATDECLDEMYDDAPFILCKKTFYDDYPDVEVEYVTKDDFIDYRGDIERHMNYYAWFKAPVLDIS